MTRWGPAYTATTNLPFPIPILSWDRFTDTKELFKPIELGLPVSVVDTRRVVALGCYNLGPATSNHVHR